MNGTCDQFSSMEALTRITLAFRARQEHVRRVLTGCKAEKWLQTEAYVALNWIDELPRRQHWYVEPEIQGMDYAIKEYPSTHTIGAIEVKALYPRSPFRTEIAVLLTQLGRKLPSDSAGRHALVFLVWEPMCRGLSYKNFAHFQADVIADLNNKFCQYIPEPLAESVITQIIQPTPTPSPLANRDIGLAAIWFTVKDTSSA